jgi:hypothetical protein
VELARCGLHGWDDVQLQVTGVALDGRHEFYEHVHAMHLRLRPVSRAVDVTLDGFEDFTRAIS